MVCGAEREDMRFPFDIRHRSIVKYTSESQSDFESLSRNITTKIKAVLSKRRNLDHIAEKQLVAEKDGLLQLELAVLAALAGDSAIPDSRISMYALKNTVENAGFTAIGFAVGIRGLVAKGFAETVGESDDFGNDYTTACVTDRGWQWIQMHAEIFELQNIKANEETLDEVPF